MVEGEEKLDVSKFPTRIESGIVRAKIEEIVGNSKGESMESIAKKLEGEDKQIAENLIEALERLKLYEEDPRFVLVKKLKNCSSYKIKEKGKPSILKSYGVVPISVIDLGAFYVPGNETKPFYDSMFAGEETLKVIAPNLRIVRQTYKAKWPTKPRDFLFAQWVYLTHGGSCYIVAADCDGTADKKFIRGKIITAGWIIKPINETESQAMYISHIDLAGSIPGFIKDSVAKTEGGQIDKILQGLKKYYSAKIK